MRPQVERRHKRTPAERALRKLLFETLPHPKRLRALAPMLAAGRRLGAERALPERLAAVAKVAPQAPVGRAAKAGVPELHPGDGRRRAAASGCCWAACSGSSIPACNARHRRASSPPRASRWWRRALPDCCGALEFHSGAEDAARRRARRDDRRLHEAGVDHVVVNAAGCGSAMKEYGELLGTTAEARAFSRRCATCTELLASVEPRAPRGPVPLRVAYHDACHLAHAQGVRAAAARAAARRSRSSSCVEVAPSASVCCGSAGIYNLVQPEAAAIDDRGRPGSSPPATADCR